MRRYVVVVLPFVPVTPTTVMRPAGSPYHLAASFAAASCASGTSTQGTPSMQSEEKASLSRRAGIEGEVMYLRPRVRAEESEVIEGAQKLAELRRRVVLSPSNLALFCGF